MSEVKHTPTPWVADENAINDNMGFEIALITSDMRTWEEDDANTAHIVKCVNLHDELVEALEIAETYHLIDKDRIIVEASLKKAGAL